MVRIQSNSQWRTAITAMFLQHGVMTENEAKEQFLKKIYQLPTFGTAFFEVKQTSDPAYPEMVIVGINKNGVSLIHPQSRVSMSNLMDYYHLFIILKFCGNGPVKDIYFFLMKNRAQKYLFEYWDNSTGVIPT